MRPDPYAISDFSVRLYNPATTTRTASRITVYRDAERRLVHLGGIGPRGGKHPELSMTPEQARWIARELVKAADDAEADHDDHRSEGV